MLYASGSRGESKAEQGREERSVSATCYDAFVTLCDTLSVLVSAKSRGSGPLYANLLLSSAPAHVAAHHPDRDDMSPECGETQGIRHRCEHQAAASVLCALCSIHL